MREAAGELDGGESWSTPGNRELTRKTLYQLFPAVQVLKKVDQFSFIYNAVNSGDRAIMGLVVICCVDYIYYLRCRSFNV